MSRSGYSDDYDGNELAMWRGAVASATRGRRGQAFFKEMLAALDAMPEKVLIADELIQDGAVCSLGAVGLRRGMDMSKIDLDDRESVASSFGIAHALACEIMFFNDEAGRHDEMPEARWFRMRAWVLSQIKGAAPSDTEGPER